MQLTRPVVVALRVVPPARLDHLDGTSNEATNLVTCCHWCNTSRHADTLDEWIERLVQEHGMYARTIRKRLRM